VKTQILHLEPHDDTVSAREKMGWTQAERILLVWPARGRLLNRRLDLVLLQRQSRQMGAQLAFVTQDPEVRFHARQLSIPVYRTPSKAKKAAWPSSAPEEIPSLQTAENEGNRRAELDALHEAAHPNPSTWQRRTDARLALFILGVLALLSVAAVLLPRAEIDLVPKTISQEILLDVKAGPEVGRMNLSGLVPARPLTVIVEGRDSLKTSGSTLYPDKTASGQVVLINLTDQPLAVPAGTIVRSLQDPPIRFETVQPGTVPAGPGRSITLRVRAVGPGRSANIPTGALEAVEGPLGLSLSATNPSPTSGGTDRRVPAPGAADYEKLNDRLRETLPLTALDELNRQLSPDDVLLPSTLILSQVVEESFEPAEVQPADWLHLNLRLEFQVLAASGEDLRTLAAGALDADLPDGYQPVPNTLKLESRSHPVEGKDGSVRWRLRAERDIRAQLADAQAVLLARGQPPSLAKQRLADQLRLASPPRISLSPSWWPWLPWAPFRIEVNNDGR
jgi:hypothetical protein